MSIEVGKKCRQIKVIEEYGFDYIGDEFEITKVTDAVIMGKGYEIGVCFGIEADKFEEYFELIEENTLEDELYNSFTQDNSKNNFNREELETIYDCLCSEKTRYEKLINKIESIIY